MITFVIPGMPVGKGRPRFARRGNFVSTYTPEKTASYENLIKVKAQEAMRGRALIEGPVSLALSIEVTPPASWSEKKKTAAIQGSILPTTKPDIDNVLKGICDAMNEIVWKDDKQVCAVLINKRYSSQACAIVEVSPM